MNMEQAIEIVRPKMHDGEKIVYCCETDKEYVFCIIFGKYTKDNVSTWFCSVNKSTKKYETYDTTEFLMKYNDVKKINLKYIDVTEEDVQNARK